MTLLKYAYGEGFNMKNLMSKQFSLITNEKMKYENKPYSKNTAKCNNFFFFNQKHIYHKFESLFFKKLIYYKITCDFSIHLLANFVI